MTRIFCEPYRRYTTQGEPVWIAPLNFPYDNEKWLLSKLRYTQPFENYSDSIFIFACLLAFDGVLKSHDNKQRARPGEKSLQDTNF